MEVVRQSDTRSPLEVSEPATENAWLRQAVVRDHGTMSSTCAADRSDSAALSLSNRAAKLLLRGKQACKTLPNKFRDLVGYAQRVKEPVKIVSHLLRNPAKFRYVAHKADIHVPLIGMHHERYFTDL